MRKVLFALAFLLPSILRAQAAAGNPPLMIFADTAGVAPYPGANNVYVTWIFAKAGPSTLPSSGILVAFNCQDRTVKRLAHVVYHLVPGDSSRVSGQIEADTTGWVKPVIPKLFTMICALGVQHTQEGIRSVQPPGVPEKASKPESPYPVS